ncbi:MAG: ABC transporter permease [Holosporales bacterium]|jgi:putrescine transport system permease protein|nr:ABC transporter permease [Holosporales bacterium]
MKKISRTSITFLIFGFAFLYIPIFFLIFFSFSESEVMGIWTKFSLKWFRSVFQDVDLLRAALTSFEIAFMSATGATILGVLAAVATTRREKFPGKKFLSRTMYMPIVMPEIVTGFSMLMLFIIIEKTAGFSIERGVISVTIGHIVASMSYVHMAVMSRLSTFDKSIDEAALNLGATPFQVFMHITIPIISNSIMAGWLLAFTMSLDDLVIASFLSGPGSTTLPILIFSNVKIGITPAINAFSTLFIGVVIVCTLITYVLSSKKRISPI